MEEEEIDLRPYVRALLRRWWVVVGLGVVAAVAGFVVSSVQPVLYQTSSVVLVTQPRYRLQFDSRFTTTQQATPPYKALLELATSNGMLQAVAEAHKSMPEATNRTLDLTTLSSMVKTSTAGDPSVMVLQVQAKSPSDSSSIANLWADQLVKKGNELFDNNAQDVTALQNQEAQAQKALDEADAALIEFQGRNPSRTLTDQLSAHEQAQKDYLTMQTTIANIIKDVQGLHGQLAKQPAGQPASLADSLTLLLLQIKTFNAGTSLPIQLQVSSPDSLSGMSRQEQIAFLDDLVTTLQNRSAESDTQLAALEPEILDLQRKLQEAQSELDGLTRRQKLAEDTQETVAAKLDEAKIADQTGNGMLQVGSYASVPQRPVSQRSLRTSAVAAIVGLMLGVFAVVAVEWWRR